MRPVEILTLVPLATLVVVFGLFPGLVLHLVQDSVVSVLGDVAGRAAIDPLALVPR
jgi:NADH:ubiquinone oxidoreductase subunit 4 (subunit M)